MSVNAVNRKKSVCFKTGEVTVQKPSLWFLPVSNTTPHIYTTPPLFKVALLLCFLAVDWPLQGQHKLPSEGVLLTLLTSLPFFYRETTGSLYGTPSAEF